MLQEYPNTRCTRKCQISGRSLVPGEPYVSVIVSSGDELVRFDVAADHWKGPPDGTIGWWRCRMPAASSARLHPAPAGVLLDTLTELLQHSNKAELSHLLALILVRRRILTDARDQAFHEDQKQSSDIWQLTSPVDGRRWNIPIAVPSTTDDANRLHAELMDLLFTEE